MSRESREHQERTASTALSARQRLFVAVAAPLLRVLARLLFATYRPVAIRGESHLAELAARSQAALLCCWHQRLVYCVGWLVSKQRHGVRPGFLVSPSRDGELIAAVVGGFGAHVIRGSANRTGARALRDMYATLKSGVSPIIAADGPHGPATKAKPGTPMLAQMTKVSMLPMSFAADRYWQLKSWDRMIIPKPFARVVVVIGEPLTCGRDDAQDAIAKTLGDRLDAITAESDVARATR